MNAPQELIDKSQELRTPDYVRLVTEFYLKKHRHSQMKPSDFLRLSSADLLHVADELERVGK